MDEQSLSDNIANLLQRVRRSAGKSQYHNGDILVIAASKGHLAADIRTAHACGIMHFGESYLQEAIKKMAALEDLHLGWHFIGPIQSNKTAPIAQNFDWVHSIDRIKIARRLSEQRPQHLLPLQVCLQINISKEASKSGTTIDALPELATTVVELPNLQLRGLMAVPAANISADEQRDAFSEMREALAQLKGLYSSVDTLSMGMSADVENAILEGATAVRVGTAIFGPRNR
ncbi:MAG: YggS family pyridoxal phosphate-dependent enzyme [Halioglobus sp.]|nr:YggS family pyridoxal phosphate-dependent enzyme [Halioglobus sp.]